MGRSLRHAGQTLDLEDRSRELDGQREGLIEREQRQVRIAVHRDLVGVGAHAAISGSKSASRNATSMEARSNLPRTVESPAFWTLARTDGPPCDASPIKMGGCPTAESWKHRGISSCCAMAPSTSTKATAQRRSCPSPASAVARSPTARG